MSLVFIINGLITFHSARILFEVDSDIVELDIKLNNVHITDLKPALEPQILVFEDLTPNTEYVVQIGNIYSHTFATLDLNHRNQIITVSCNDVQENNDRLWKIIETKIEGHKNTILIHMGDQIYGDNLDYSQKRDLYRRSYNISTPQGRVMSKTINLMLPDDHEFINNANPFSGLNMTMFNESLDLVNRYQKILTPDEHYYKYIKFPHFDILFIDQRVQRIIDNYQNGYLGIEQRNFISSMVKNQKRELIVITQSPLAVMGEFFVSLYGKDPVKYDFYNYGPNLADTIWLLDELAPLSKYNLKIVSGDIHFGACIVYSHKHNHIHQYVTSSISAPYETKGENIFQKEWAKLKYSNIQSEIGGGWDFHKTRPILWTNTFGLITNTGEMQIIH